MTAVHVPPGGVLLLNLRHMPALASRCPDIYAAIVEDTAFINFRKVELGQPPVLCLSFDNDRIEPSISTREGR